MRWLFLLSEEQRREEEGFGDGVSAGAFVERNGLNALSLYERRSHIPHSLIDSAPLDVLSVYGDWHSHYLCPGEYRHLVTS